MLHLSSKDETPARKVERADLEDDVRPCVERANGLGFHCSCLRECQETIKGDMLSVWSAEGRELAAVANGAHQSVQIDIGLNCRIAWSCGGIQGHFALHPETGWLRVMRSESKFQCTTWRCYKAKPPSLDNVPCKTCGRLLHKGFSSIFSFMMNSSCTHCSRAIRRDVIRLQCRLCRTEICTNCSDHLAWAAQEDPLKSSAAEKKAADVLPVATENDDLPARILGRQVALKLGPMGGKADDSGVLKTMAGLGACNAEHAAQDNLARLGRLLKHGDTVAARRTLLRSMMLGVEGQDLKAHQKACTDLKTAGNFHLLLQDD